MMLAEAVQVSEIGAGQLALYPIGVIALGALVKWWMSGTERAIKAVAEDVKLVVAAQGEQREKLARLDERAQQLRVDLDRLHAWKNDFIESIGSK